MHAANESHALWRSVAADHRAARDSSTPLARLELGTAAGSFGRYARRLAPGGDVVTIAEFEVQRLTDLLKAVGAGT